MFVGYVQTLCTLYFVETSHKSVLQPRNQSRTDVWVAQGRGGFQTFACPSLPIVRLSVGYIAAPCS